MASRNTKKYLTWGGLVLAGVALSIISPATQIKVAKLMGKTPVGGA